MFLETKISFERPWPVFRGKRSVAGQESVRCGQKDRNSCSNCLYKTARRTTLFHFRTYGRCPSFLNFLKKPVFMSRSLFYKQFIFNHKQAYRTVMPLPVSLYAKLYWLLTEKISISNKIVAISIFLYPNMRTCWKKNYFCKSKTGSSWPRQNQNRFP